MAQGFKKVSNKRFFSLKIKSLVFGLFSRWANGIWVLIYSKLTFLRFAFKMLIFNSVFIWLAACSIALYFLHDVKEQKIKLKTSIGCLLFCKVLNVCLVTCNAIELLLCVGCLLACGGVAAVVFFIFGGTASAFRVPACDFAPPRSYSNSHPQSFSFI